MRERVRIPPVLRVVMTLQTTIDEGKRVYETLRPTLEIKFSDQYVAIDPVSKEYFIDPAMGQALAKAQSRYPGRDFYTTQIGERTAIKMKV